MVTLSPVSIAGIKELSKDVQRALLQSDVNVKLVLNLSKNIEKRALQEKPPAGMSNREHVIHIVYEELVKILGKSRELPIKKQIIMMTGLYGQGKTTSCGKLATYFKKRGLRPALIAGDVHRPAAYEQLKQISEKVKVPFYGDKKEKSAVKVVNDGINELTIRNDAVLSGISAEYVNGTKVTVGDTAPTGTILAADVWIETP